MPKTERVFKALRKAPSGYRYSAIIRDKGARIHYPLRKVVEAPNGCPPLAFGEERQAKDFANYHTWQMERPNTPEGPRCKIEVWECEATGVEPVSEVTCRWESLKTIRKFWRLLREAPDQMGKFPDPMHLGDAPPGTVSCQTIKLVRKVA